MIAEASPTGNFKSRARFAAAGLIIVLLLMGYAGTPRVSSAADEHSHSHTVTVPEEDRFTPFALTIHSGDSVEWVNKDTDDHTVVSDDAFNTTGPKGLDHMLPGTVANGGNPGILLPLPLASRRLQPASGSRTEGRYSGCEWELWHADDGRHHGPAKG